MSDFLSECWSRLRQQTRLETVRSGVEYGSALSGRDRRAVDLTTDGLLKLISPDAEAPIADEDLEWAVRLALECRRRVKEQQLDASARTSSPTPRCSIRIGGRELSVDVPEGAPGVRARPPTRTNLNRLHAVNSSGARRRTYAVGDTVDGTFEVRGPLGKGGFSNVYRVYRAMDSKEYAVKGLQPARQLRSRQARARLPAGYRPSEHREGRLGRPDRRWPLVSRDRTRRRRVARGCCNRWPTPYDLRGAPHIGEELLDALIAIHPDEVRITELKAKSDALGLEAGEFEELLELEAGGMIHREHQAAEHPPQARRAHRRHRLQHRIARRRPCLDSLRHTAVPGSRRRLHPMGRVGRPLRLRCDPVRDRVPEPPVRERDTCTRWRATRPPHIPNRHPWPAGKIPHARAAPRCAPNGSRRRRRCAPRSSRSARRAPRRGEAVAAGRKQGRRRASPTTRAVHTGRRRWRRQRFAYRNACAGCAPEPPLVSPLPQAPVAGRLA